MKNERNAGRKSKINHAELEEIKKRIANGEKVAHLATEYGMSRQALYKKIKEDDAIFKIDYLIDGVCATQIEVDTKRERIQVINYARQISKRAFGVKQNPDWDDLADFLLRQYIIARSDGEAIHRPILCFDQNKDSFLIEEMLGGNLQVDESQQVPKVHFRFEKKDILYTRTDTDGFQLKALSSDRKWFVKSQAILGGKCMDDWAVEIIASDLCRQLDIPCVYQRECVFVYGSRSYKGVYSENFEQDGYSFISFESLLERNGMSSRDEAFIKLAAIDKLKWCAKMLSQLGGLSYGDTQKYMLDLALIDCLVGNVDRHTRNFGLFYNVLDRKYEVPMIFDNGMGLFEHDCYEYASYEDAMRSVYVAPYGEDPFEMIQMLDEEFSLRKIYPKLTEFVYKSHLQKPFAVEYMERMRKIWQN